MSRELPIGAHGNIPPAREIRPGIWEARCRVHDGDGATRFVKRQGASANAAKNNLLAALVERKHDGAAQLGGASKVSEVAALWLERQRELVDAGDRAPRTLETYEAALRLHVLPGLGQLRLREATPARCDTWLVALRRTGLGASMCSTSRSVASGVFGLATRLGAITANPMRDVAPIPGSGSRKRKPRAMTAAERTAWLDWMDNNVAHDPSKPRKQGLHRDPAVTIAGRALGDVTRFMLSTGVRIGEAMAVSWDEVDLEARTVAICWHLVRIRGRGIVRMEGAKSEAGDRVLRLPANARDMLMTRRIDPNSGYPIFPDELGGWRDPNLVMRWIRWSREPAGFGWVTSHVWRQTVISVLDAEGLKTREVADQAGHAEMRQTQQYMARGVASDRAADALEQMY